MRITISLVLSLLIGAPPVSAWDGSAMVQQAGEFALDKAREVRDLAVGPLHPGEPARPDPLPDCAAIYARRLTLLRQQLDYKPALTSDPQYGAAAFVGTMWTPAFYYLPYRAVSSLQDQWKDARPQAELDMLRHLSAQQRCFER